MVEIGTNSSDDFVAARDRLSGAMSPAELEALAGFAPWANPKPEMPYASSAAAEPAVAFLRDDEALNQPSGSERPPLTLVADNGEAQATAEDTRSDASALLSYILSLDEDIKKLLSGEIAALTSALQSGKSSGVDVGAIRLLIDAAKATSDASKAAESAEAKFKQAYENIEKLEVQAKQAFDELPTSDKEKAERQKLVDAEEEAKRSGNKQAILAAAAARTKFDKEAGQKYDPGGVLQENAADREREIAKAREALKDKEGIQKIYDLSNSRTSTSEQPTAMQPTKPVTNAITIAAADASNAGLPAKRADSSPSSYM